MTDEIRRKEMKRKKRLFTRALCLVMCFALCMTAAGCKDDKGKVQQEQPSASADPAAEEKAAEKEATLPAVTEPEEDEKPKARDHVQTINYDIRESREYSEYDVLEADEYLKSDIYAAVQKMGEYLANQMQYSFHEIPGFDVVGVFRVPNGIISESGSGLYVYRVDFGFKFKSGVSDNQLRAKGYEYDGTYVRSIYDWYCYSFVTTEYETGRVIKTEDIYWKDSKWIDENCYTHSLVTEHGNRYEASAFAAFDYYNENIRDGGRQDVENSVEARDSEAKTLIREYFGGEYEIASMEYMGYVAFDESISACYHVDGDYVILSENSRRASNEEPYFYEVLGLMPSIEVGSYEEAIYDIFFQVSDIQAAICYEPYGYYAAYGARGMFFGLNDYYYGSNSKKLDLPIWEGGSDKDYYYTEGVKHIYNLWYHNEDSDGNSFEYFIKTAATGMAKTYRGITFGDTREKVLEAYPEINTEPNSSIDEDRDYMWYSKYPESLGGDVLVIVFENDIVIELQSVHLYGYL